MSERAGGRRWQIGLVLGVLGTACSASPPPQRPGPATAVTVVPMPATNAAPVASAPSAAPAATAAQGSTIVIHEADLFGEIQSRTGATVHVAPLVATRTPPGVGVKGVLFRGVEDQGNTAWLAIADVTVKKESNGGSDMQLTIDDEKKDALIGGKKVNHFTKGVRVKLRWEY